VADDLVEGIEPAPAPAEPPRRQSSGAPHIVEGIDVTRLTNASLRDVLCRLAARSQPDPQTHRDRVLLTRRVARLERENDTLRRQLVITAADMAALSLGPSEPDYDEGE
jgi:hypothetical protein